MKKHFTILAALALILSLAALSACKKNPPAETPTPTPTPISTPTPAPSPSPTPAPTIAPTAKPADTEPTVYDGLTESVELAYSGIMKNGEGRENGTAYYGITTDSRLIVAYVNQADSAAVIYIGPYEINENGTVTVTDETSGESLILTVMPMDDEDAHYLDLTSYNAVGYVLPIEVSELIDALREIGAGL